MVRCVYTRRMQVKSRVLRPGDLAALNADESPRLNVHPPKNAYMQHTLGGLHTDLLDSCVLAIVRYRYAPYTHARPYAGRWLKEVESI